MRPAIIEPIPTASYTVRFEQAIYVLHVFQKKSKRGVQTPRKEIALVKQRLKVAEEDYRRRQN
jgi:phage-related protein